MKKNLLVTIVPMTSVIYSPFPAEHEKLFLFNNSVLNSF
jgi:hypothetical protein